MNLNRKDFLHLSRVFGNVYVYVLIGVDLKVKYYRKCKSIKNIISITS